MRTGPALLSVIFLLALPTSLLANAWMLNANEWFVETYNKYYWATEDYDHRGDREEKPNDGRYEEFRTELKLEYGLHEQLNLLLAIPYKWARWEDINATLENDGLEFVGVGAKFRLSEESTTVPAASLQIKYEMPGGYDEDEPPSLGHGESDLEMRLMVGKILDIPSPDASVKLYHLGAEIGYRTRNNKIPYFLEVGIQPAPYVLVKGMIDGVFATSDIDRPATDDELIGKEYEEYSRVIGEVLYSRDGAFGILKDEVGLGIGVGYGYTFHGENTSVGSEVTLKAYLRF